MLQEYPFVLNTDAHILAFFYVLIKAHKEILLPTGRNVMSGCNSMKGHSPNFLLLIFSIPEVKSHLKVSMDFLSNTEEMYGGGQKYLVNTRCNICIHQHSPMYSVRYNRNHLLREEGRKSLSYFVITAEIAVWKNSFGECCRIL